MYLLECSKYSTVFYTNLYSDSAVFNNIVLQNKTRMYFNLLFYIDSVALTYIEFYCNCGSNINGGLVYGFTKRGYNATR